LKKVVKVLCAVCILSVLFALITGCKPTETPDNQGTTAPTSAAPKDVTLRFSWWGGDPRHEALLNVIDLYTKQNLHVKIEPEYGGYSGYYEKLITQLAGKTAPDVMHVAYQWIPDFKKQGVEYFLDLYTVPDIVDTSEVDASLIEQYLLVDGKLQGLPAGSTGLGLIYNKEFFKKHGIPEDIEFSWNTLLETGKKVHENDPNDYLLNANAYTIYTHLFPTYLNQMLGEHCIRDDNTFAFTEAQLLDTLTYIKKLFDEGVVEPLEESSLFSPESNPKWINGNMGLCVVWSASAPGYINNVSFDVGATRYPVAENAKDTAISVTPPGFIAVNKESNHIEEAAKFLNFFINDNDAILTKAEAMGAPPSDKGRNLLLEAGKTGAVPSQVLDLAIKNVGLAETTILYNAEVADILSEVVEKLGFGRISPEEATAELMTKLGNKLDEFK
jgi:oligogalacturonide transport system substrate-binding protein